MSEGEVRAGSSSLVELDVVTLGFEEVAVVVDITEEIADGEV